MFWRIRDTITADGGYKGKVIKRQARGAHFLHAWAHPLKRTFQENTFSSQLLPLAPEHLGNTQLSSFRTLNSTIKANMDKTRCVVMGKVLYLCSYCTNSALKLFHVFLLSSCFPPVAGGRLFCSFTELIKTILLLKSLLVCSLEGANNTLGTRLQPEAGNWKLLLDDPTSSADFNELGALITCSYCWKRLYLPK